MAASSSLGNVKPLRRIGLQNGVNKSPPNGSSRQSQLKKIAMALGCIFAIAWAGAHLSRAGIAPSALSQRFSPLVASPKPSHSAPHSLDFANDASDICGTDGCAYATFLCDNELLPAVLVLLRSLQKVHSRYPVEVLVLPDVTAKAREALELLGGHVQEVQRLTSPFPGAIEPGINHQCRYSKLHIFGMLERRKVLYLDADVMVRKNIDHLFQLDYDLAGVTDIGDIMNTGVILIKPSERHYNRMLETHATAPSYNKGDQGFINWYRGVAEDYHVGYLPGRYNVQAKHLHSVIGPASFRQAYVLHFTSETKPWSLHYQAHRDWNVNLHHGMFYQWAIIHREVTTILRDALHVGRAGLFARGHLDSSSHVARSAQDAQSLERDSLATKKAAILARLDSNKFTDSGRRIHNFCSKFKVATVDKGYPDIDHFSIVISFFNADRLDMLRGLIEHYQRSPVVAKIYILWANKNLAIPTDLASQSGVGLIQPATASLNERFNPPSDLTTQAVFIADDDLLYPLEDLETAFAAWQARPYSQVGFFARQHRYRDGVGSYHDDKHQYSMILTKGVFLNARYLHAYTCLMPPEIHDYVDSGHNCEDIAMNMLVAGMTGQRPLYAKASSLQDYGTFKGISASTGHVDARSTCVDDLIALFGRSTLQTSSDMVAPFIPNRFVKRHVGDFKKDLEQLDAGL